MATFIHCCCPHCKHPLDEVATTTPACPLCNAPLDPHAVWLTRRYPGVLILPGWLKAFGWPFFLMLGGFGIVLFGWFTDGSVPLKLPAFMIAVGMVFFLVKLATNGEDL